MDPGDDAYAILGVQETATLAEIKKAYRKLALQHHPDRNGATATAGTGANRNENQHHVFAKISNAYEILSDTNKRAEYDQARAYGFQYDDSPVGDDDGQYHAHDSHSNNAARGSQQRQRQAHHHHHHPDFFSHFHDPFEIFEQFFQHEFGSSFPSSSGRSNGPPNNNGMFGGRGGHNPFDDPFFRSPFGGLGADPIFGGPSLFGGSLFPPPPPHHHHHPDPFFASARSMMSPHDFFNHGNVLTATSTSSFGGLGGGGSSVSTSTTTRIINGRRETVTERVVRHADGRVERTVQRSDGTSTTTTTNNNDHRLPSSSHQDRPALVHDTNGSIGTGGAPLRSGQTRPRSSDYHSQSQSQSQLQSPSHHPIIDLTGEEDDIAAATMPHRRSSTRHQDKKTKRSSQSTGSATDGKNPLKFWKS